MITSSPVYGGGGSGRSPETEGAIRDLGTRYLARAKTLRRSMTKAEVLLWSRLRKSAIGLRFRRQHSIGPYIADFACPMRKLIVEIDGATHSTNEEVARDCAREDYIKSRGWQVLRFQNQDVYDHLDQVIETIGRMAPSAPDKSGAPPP